MVTTPLSDLPADGRITGVADTALWVAACRAQETKRPDSVLTDSLADILAGRRGAAIARKMPRARLTAWSVLVRTCAIDRLITEALACGIDTVINLGAGLDTRPYRLPLPRTLRWVEVDLPTLIDYKNARLADQRPRCELIRMGADLQETHTRKALFDRMHLGKAKVLVITEGVLPYFSVSEVFSLASELHSLSGICCWIQDFENAGPRSMPRAWRRRLSAAPLIFSVRDWFEFFGKSGWAASSIITSGEESVRLKRQYPAAFPLGLLMKCLPQELQKTILDASGAVLLRKSAET